LLEGIMATGLAVDLPITRQAIAKHLALLAGVGLVMAEPGERRRVRYRLRSAPVQVAQHFLAALARDWDSTLGALAGHLDQGAQRSPGRPVRGTAKPTRTNPRTPADQGGDDEG
jgi:hypothetical protein